MKTMTGKELGGACDLELNADSFEEIAEMSKKHGMDMFQKKDAAHLKAVNNMRSLMKTPEDMTNWIDKKRKEFDALPNNN